MWQGVAEERRVFWLNIARNCFCYTHLQAYCDCVTYQITDRETQREMQTRDRGRRRVRDHLERESGRFSHHLRREKEGFVIIYLDVVSVES